MVNAATFKGRNIISMREFDRAEIDFILDTADDMVKLEQEGSDLLKGKVMAALFFEPSTRTRLSFKSAMNRLGGGVIGFATPAGSSVEKGESLMDTIRTVSQYSDIITMRHPDEMSSRNAVKVASVPVINGLSDYEHPCQCLADLLTVLERKGRLQGLKIAYLGDGNNVAHSLIFAAAKTGLHLTLAIPYGYEPDAEVVKKAQNEAAQT